MKHQVFKLADMIAPRVGKEIRVLAFDPSLSCTGFALADVWDDGRMPAIKVHRFGYIIPPGTEKKLWERVSACADMCESEWTMAVDLQVVAVEMPMIVTGGVREDRSIAWLPGYGVMCGAVADRMEQRIRNEDIGIEQRRTFYAPSATDWSSGLRTGGRGKPERISMANLHTGFDLVKIVGKTHAEEVADAILLARWTAIAFMARRKKG